MSDTVKRLLHELKHGIDKRCLPSALTSDNAAVPDNFNQKYSLLNDEECSFHINSFEILGLNDPFPTENGQDTDKAFGKNNDSETNELYGTLVYDKSFYQYG